MVIWKGFGILNIIIVAVCFMVISWILSLFGMESIDPETGQQYQMGTQHSLFFVPCNFGDLSALLSASSC